MYYSLIYPFLIYALPIYGTADSIHGNSIHILQKKVVRLVTFIDPISHSLPIFKELEVLTIFEVFKVETSKFVFESLNHMNPHQLHDFFTYPSNARNRTNTRNKNLFIPQAKTKHYGLIWNDIPLSIRLSKSKNMFVRALKNFLVLTY